MCQRSGLQEIFLKSNAQACKICHFFQRKTYLWLVSIHAATGITKGPIFCKICGWKQWERETLSLTYEFSKDPSRHRLSRETSFVEAHSSLWNRIPFTFYIDGSLYFGPPFL